MKTNFFKNLITSKFILYTSAALLITASPLSVHASEESAQTESSPSVSTAEPESSEAASSDNNSSETASSEASTAEEASSAVSSEPASSEAASSEASTAEEASTPENASTPAQTPENSINPPVQDKLPELSSPSNDSFDVTPMQATVYAATQSGLNVRSGPATSYDKLGTLKYGQEITVTGKIGNDWYQIRYSNGYGYVAVQYVSDTPLAADNPSGAESLPDTVTDMEIGTEQPDTETSSADTDTEAFSGLLGTPVVVVLVFAILGVIALIGYSVYGLFKKDTTSEDDMAYSEDEYYDDFQDDDSCPEDEYYDASGNNAVYSENAYDNEEEDTDIEYESDTYFEDEYDEQEYDKNNRQNNP